MRTLLLAATLCTASLAFAKSTPKPTTHLAAERAVNQRLDKQLHATLQKLIAAQVQTASMVVPATALLTQR